MVETDLVSVVAATEVRRHTLCFVCLAFRCRVGHFFSLRYHILLNAHQTMPCLRDLLSSLPVQELKERQETPDTPEALECIPSLSLGGEALPAAHSCRLAGRRSASSVHA